jgi:urate oxidase
MASNTTSPSTPSRVRETVMFARKPCSLTVMLEGDIATSYTEADNSCVVATDTSKSCGLARYF